MNLIRAFLILAGFSYSLNNVAEQNAESVQAHTTQEPGKKISDDEGKFIIMHYLADKAFSEQDYESAKGGYLYLLKSPYLSTYKLRDGGLAYAQLMSILGALYYYEDENSEEGRKCWDEAAFYGSPTVLFAEAVTYYYGLKNNDRAIHLLEKALACTHEYYKLNAEDHKIAVKLLIELYEKVGNKERVAQLREQESPSH